MTKPLLAILLLLPLSVSAGEVDGRAISCDGWRDYEFRRGQVVAWRIWTIGSKAILEDYPELADDYYTSHTTIWWLDVSSKKDKPLEYTTTEWSLNRKTLALTVTVDDKVKEKWSCEVYSVEDFKNMLEARRTATQKMVEEEMKGNKI